MTRKDLESLKKDELKKAAKKAGAKLDDSMKKDEMIDAILKASKDSGKPAAKKSDKEIQRKPSKKKDEAAVKKPSLDEANDTVRGESKKFEIEDRRVYIEPSYELMGDETYDLPDGYNVTRMTLLVQDPYWVHAYWEIDDATRKKHGIEFGKHNRKMVIRVYQPGTGTSFDVDINDSARSWYFNVPKPATAYYAEVGFVDEKGKYVALVKSNTVQVPTNKPSDVYDEKWMQKDSKVQEEIFKKSGGYVIHKQVGSQSFAEWAAVPSSVSSGGSGSGGVAAKKLPKGEKKRKFWAELHTELIVYGATEPDAIASVGGVPVKLSPNGTFSVRFYLKDGEHSVPFVATSSDGEDTISITPFVNKFTERKEKKNK